ncbi:hypothetical protein SUGI_1120760 [Cryptomeria japonica]|nr:hypothetical protein SUGI_1120760 [Cryptomeria japonica]
MVLKNGEKRQVKNFLFEIFLQRFSNLGENGFKFTWALRNVEQNFMVAIMKFAIFKSTKMLNEFRMKST